MLVESVHLEDAQYQRQNRNQFHRYRLRTQVVFTIHDADDINDIESGADAA